MNDFYVEDLYAQKAADMCGISVVDFLKMRDRNFLNTTAVKHELIRYDAYALLKTKKFTEQQVFERLSGLYGVSVTQIQRVIKMNPKRIYYCKKCGQEISKTIFKRNDGMCKGCFTQSIKV